MKSVSVYLDNMDFSHLSNPKTLTPERRAVLDELIWLKQKGLATFWYSGIHLSETAPRLADNIESAERRVDLIGQLCGRKAMVAADRLVSNEFSRLEGGVLPLDHAFSESGEWFSVLSDDFLSQPSEQEVCNIVREEIGGVGNRSERRRKEREFIKNGRLRPSYRNNLRANAGKFSLEDVLAKYPMPIEQAKILARFSVGSATVAEAREAFLTSFRDPMWMIRWFSHNSEKLQSIVDWTQEPAKELVRKFGETILALKELASEEEVDAKKIWVEMKDDILLRILNGLLQTMTGRSVGGVSLAEIGKVCPSICVCFGSLFSAWDCSLQQKTPRTPDKNDFTDALHALYAPHVDIFRADGFMAPHIAKQIERYGCATRVVPKLRMLPDVIRELITARGCSIQN